MWSPLEISSLGRFAQAALHSGPARLIAVFGRSGYVETPAGLACIGVPAIGNGPLNAIVAEFPHSAAVGDTLQFDLARASAWRPHAAPAWNPHALAKSLARMRAAARDSLATEGFGFLLDPDAILPPPVRALARWLADPSGSPSGAEGLIGLGPGLTPSGDDLIGGALCALHATRRNEIAERLSTWALPLSETGTNRISRAHLACAAQGACGEVVNDAIVALLRGDLPDLARIDAVGHTSGWDALAGAVLVLALVRTTADLPMRPGAD